MRHTLAEGVGLNSEKNTDDGQKGMNNTIQWFAQVSEQTVFTV